MFTKYAKTICTGHVFSEAALHLIKLIFFKYCLSAFRKLAYKIGFYDNTVAIKSLYIKNYLAHFQKADIVHLPKLISSFSVIMLVMH